MKKEDWIAKAVQGLATHKPSKGFDARVLTALRAEKTSPVWRWAAGFALTWACGGAAVMALLPSRLKIALPNAVEMKLALAAYFVDAVRFLSDAAQNAASLDLGRLGIQLLAATLVAAASMAVLAPHPIRHQGEVR